MHMINPDRPPKEWFYYMVERIRKKSSAYEPTAVAGQIWWHEMAPTTKRKIMKIVNAQRAKGKVAPVTSKSKLTKKQVVKSVGKRAANRLYKHMKLSQAEIREARSRMRKSKKRAGATRRKPARRPALRAGATRRARANPLTEQEVLHMSKEAQRLVNYGREAEREGDWLRALSNYEQALREFNILLGYIDPSIEHKHFENKIINYIDNLQNRISRLAKQTRSTMKVGKGTAELPRGRRETIRPARYYGGAGATRANPELMLMMNPKMPSVDDIVRYEDGAMSDEEIVKFFAELVKSGMAWKLQGHYGRTAASLIQAGYLDRNGKILKYPNPRRHKKSRRNRSATSSSVTTSRAPSLASIKKKRGYKAALKRHRKLHGCDPEEITVVEVPYECPEFLIALGMTPDAIYTVPDYSKKRGGKNLPYKHNYENPVMKVTDATGKFIGDLPLTGKTHVDDWIYG